MSPSRRAFTLLELMIVLVILVAVMSVAWPRMTGQIQLVAPREAALQMKSDLSEAREQAVVSGEPWALRIERGTAKYEIGPVSEFREQEESIAVATPGAGVGVGGLEGLTLAGQTTIQPAVVANPLDALTVGTPSLIEKLELPTGMLFDDGWAHSTQDVNKFKVDPNLLSQTQQPVLPATPVVAPSNWKYVVIFQPDGRATEAEMRLKDEASEAKIRLSIRGLTGGVTIHGVERKRPATELIQDPTQPNVEEIPGIDADSQTPNAGTPLDQQGLPLPTAPSTLPTLEAR